jgi:hypothetical protein
MVQLQHWGPGTAHDKIAESLALLTSVQDRLAAARSALACGAKASGADALGPVISCPTPVTSTQGGSREPSTRGDDSDSAHPSKKPAKAWAG